MPRQETKLDILVGVEGTEKLRGLTSSLKRLKDSSTIAGDSSRKLALRLKQQTQTATQTISGTRSLANSYRQLANNVKIGSREFKVATRRAEQLEARLRKLNTTARKGRSLKGMAQTAGAVAGAGVFGGVEGAIGAGIGGILGGGAPGALVGGAIGAQVGNVRKSLSSLSEYSAQLGLQRKALRLVINDTDKYAASQKFLADTSDKLAIPQDIITRQFTSLTASVTGAGQSVEDAQKVFEAIAAGIRGTGGSLEDMKSAMRATSQVFSKGKVSAEELRQQLGERLPGAFTLFAESMNKTPAQLDKALEQGTVTLDDFMKFSETLFKKYCKNAEILADSPQAAGDRLQTEMSKLKDNLGQILEPIGADFQDTFTKITKKINEAAGALRKFYKIGEEYQAEKLKELLAEKADIERQIKIYEKLIPTLQPFEGLTRLNRGQAVNALEALKEQLTEIIPKIEAIKAKIKETTEETKKLKKETEDLKKTSDEVFKGLKGGVQEYLNSIKDVSKQIENAVVGAFQNMEDALVKFTMTGKLNFNDFARQLIEDINRIIIRQKIMMPLLKGIDHLFNLDLKLDAQGSAYNQQGVISQYAKGGVVTQPTFFRYGGAGNLGLMGEAGAEAILPLKRGRSGNLGVESSGSGSTNIVVNVDASGSSVEGDSAQANEFGNVLAAAIQAELINQQRAGGILSNA